MLHSDFLYYFFVVGPSAVDRKFMLAKLIRGVERSLIVTGFRYEHEDAWATNIKYSKNSLILAGVDSVKPPSSVAVAKPILGSLVCPGLTFPLSTMYGVFIRA
ncbi:hypothetical protein MKW98_013371 [Papaver atlanticum]|uniref:Uncharacterized protein n=1 Tax=Papaver atlanticum TaxID=357466 RepID=A0AAD4XK49_9MAGN|nr:hypothetical protein MKW98_013371 [Papaver atlanticum]